jgi:hypothetical protein
MKVDNEDKNLNTNHVGVAYKTTTRVNYMTSQENFKEVSDRLQRMCIRRISTNHESFVCLMTNRRCPSNFQAANETDSFIHLFSSKTPNNKEQKIKNRPSGSTNSLDLSSKKKKKP